MVTKLDRTARLHVDLLGPVHGNVFVGAEQSAVRAVEHIGKTVTIEVSQGLVLLAVDIHVGQHILVDAVIVPLIEGGHLIGKHGLAGVNLAAENRHRPLVVETTSVALFVGLVRATIGRAPQAGVTGRVVDHLELGVVTVPAPSSAATDLVVLSREGLDAEIGTSLTELRIGFVSVCRQAHVLVGAGALALPSHRALLYVVSRDTTARGELVAAEADEHLVVGDQRSRGDGLTLLGPSGLDHPDFLASLAVEGNHEAVEGAIDELAVGIGTATVDRVAASTGNGRLTTIR